MKFIERTIENKGEVAQFISRPPATFLDDFDKTPPRWPGWFPRLCTTSKFQRIFIAQKRWDHPGKRGGVSLTGEVFLAILLVVMGIGCDSDRATPDAQHELSTSQQVVVTKFDIDRNFVGSDKCGECHAEIEHQYAAHPMARSVSRTSDLSRRIESETAQVSDPANSWDYRVSADERGLIHSELLKRPIDADSIEQHFHVEFAIGSGQRGRSYLINRNGVLFMSPLTWYSHAQRWGFSPGYQPAKNRRFSRQISNSCLACHVGTVAVADAQRENIFANEPFPEPSISCERCHGPGQRHIEYQKRLPNHRNGSDPYATQAQLDMRHKDAICNQCHLQGEHRVLRLGQNEFDFRPGNSIEDFWIVFLKSTAETTGQEIQAVSQVEHMSESACFRGSQGQFGCLSCHDAHSTPKPEEAARYYESRCRHCHSTSERDCSVAINVRSEERRSCIGCHMPRLDASDVPHTSQTDHRVLRTPKSTRSKTYKSESERLYGDTEQSVPPHEITRARAIRIVLEAEDRHQPAKMERAIPMLEESVRINRQDFTVWNCLGNAYFGVGDTLAATQAWHRALELNPSSESAIDGLSILTFRARDLQAAEKWARLLIRVNPARVDAHARLSRILLNQQRYQDAEEQAAIGLQLDVGFPTFHEIIAEVATKTARPEVAKKHHEVFIQLK